MPTMPLPACLLWLMTAVAKSQRRRYSRRALGHCGRDAADRGAVGAAYIELALCAVVRACVGVARCTNEKTVRLDAMPTGRHETSAAANTQQNAARHPTPHTQHKRTA